MHARVENGWVTLDGEVDYAYQKREAEVDARHVKVEVTDHTAKQSREVKGLAGLSRVSDRMAC